MLGSRLVLVLVATLLAAPAAAAAEPTPTCEGEQATIVGDGSTAQTLTGTDGPDVIVTNGATDVDAAGGDDLICVTGGLTNLGVEVQDGDGDDEVHNLSEATADPSRGEDFRFFLEGGIDTFVGGPSIDVVTTYEGADDISTGAGRDNVSVFDRDTHEDFTGSIDLGADGGDIQLSRPAPAATLDGGDGGSLALLTTFGGTWDVDNATGTGTSDERQTLHWTNMTGFGWAANPVRFTGTDRSERLSGSEIRTAELGGGDDAVSVTYGPDQDVEIDGGPGSDRLQVNAAQSSPQPLRIDVLAGRVRYNGSGSASLDFEGFEAYGATLGLTPTTIIGTDGPDAFDVYGCSFVLRAGAGNDVLTARSDDEEQCRPVTATFGGPGADRLTGTWPSDRLHGEDGNDVLQGRFGLWASGGRGNDQVRGTSSDDVVHAGPGADLMVGLRGPDHLDGDRGRDTARGGPGRDVCRAEVRSACEAS